MVFKGEKLLLIHASDKRGQVRFIYRAENFH